MSASDLGTTIETLLGQAERIAPERRALLEELAAHISGRSSAGDPARLVFVCTHNSRRSHLAQCWARAAADHFGIAGVETYSGGTEVTAFEPRAAAALARCGFDVGPRGDGENPVVEVGCGGAEPVRAWSKIYDRPPNPTAEYVAVMTCASADAGCPVAPGADARFAVTWNDPKAADGTGRESAVYDERCRQIGREMLYLFSRVGA